eukprot:13993487-Alexandrium_andersonii.AAC.1
MSASLVGSEMCIRDSSLDARWTCGGRSLGVRWAFVGRSLGVSWTLVGWSVSYTHLTLPTICSV